jgi:hypothetical protein
MGTRWLLARQPAAVNHDRCWQPQTYVKPKAAITVFELLMMSGVSLETCWAIKKHWNNKFYYTVASCWLFLQDLHVTGFIRFPILVMLPADGSELLKQVGDDTVIVYTLGMCWELNNKKPIILHRMYTNTFHSSGPSFQSHVPHEKVLH